MKLRTKFYLIYSVLTLIPLCAILSFSYQQYNRTTYQRMDEYSNNIFNSAVSEVNSSLESVSQSIRFLTFYSDDTADSVVHTLKQFSDPGKNFTSYDIFKANQYCNNVFSNLLISNDSIHGIYLFTPADVTFSCSNPQYSTLSENYNPKKDYWYSQTLESGGSYYISSHTADNMFTDDSPSIYFSLSVKDVYTHKFMGVILVDCDPDILNLDNVNTLPDITLMKVQNQDNGSLLYSNEKALKKDFANSKIVTKTKKLSVVPLALTASFDYDALFDTYKIGYTMLLGIAAVCVIGYMILTYFITKNLVHPLEALCTAMTRQQQQQFAFSSPYMNRTDEIGTLYNEYAHMLEELNTSIKHDYKDKLILLDAQMKSLEAQINSHFLFNTLESINSMAELEDNEQIATMSLALGNMFRYSIKTESELVTLRDELQHVQNYVSIQKIRFSNRFLLVTDIPDSLYDEKVLKLILQPLVENALYHGLNYCARGDRITIHAERNSSGPGGNVLKITVLDNGQGISEETLKQIQLKLKEEAKFTELGHRNKQSIGLKNIHSRIELYYGVGYGLQVESRRDQGTCITILIPVTGG